MSSALDYCARDRLRLLDALSLTDAELIRALGGSRRTQLRAEYESFGALGQAGGSPAIERVCGHDGRYPASLASAGAPTMLSVLGAVDRLATLARGTAVAIVGARAASDYGIEMARSLAQGLAICGVTVVSTLDEGIAAGAQRGALDAGGPSVAVLGRGLEVTSRATLGGLRERIAVAGCAISELPDNLDARLWGDVAAVRIVVALAALVVVVEATDTPGDLFAPALAHSGGTVVAAIPGRVNSPLSAGSHALLIGGARLARGTEDVLDLLCEIEGKERRPRSGEPAADGLDARRREVLDRVGAGWDTAERLAANASDPAATLATLSELEVLGLLARGDGGRYVRRHPAPRRSKSSTPDA